MTEQTKSDRWTYLWLALGAILLLFANGRWIIPLAIWLAGVFIIRFLRTQKPVRGLILVLLASIVVTIVAWRGMIPVPGVFYYLIAAGIGIAIFVVVGDVGTSQFKLFTTVDTSITTAPR